MSMKRIKKEESGGGEAKWLTTFNDMMTLLMVFFVLIFTMSSLDVEMMKGFQKSLRSGLGILDAGKMVGVKLVEPQAFVDMKGMTLQDIMLSQLTDLKDNLEKVGNELGVDVTYTKMAVVITLKDAVFFESGKGHINKQAYPVLDTIVDTIKKISNKVRIEGHTDNIPISTERFPSNWELSTARAVNVLNYLAEKGGVDPKRFSAIGYGESRPIFPNDNQENMAKNRRVEIVIVKEANEQDV